MALACLSCTREQPERAHEVRYVLTWKADDWQTLAGARQQTNDLGYVIRLTRGYVLSRDVEITECPQTAHLADMWRGLVDSLVAPPAFASHSSAPPNPAAIHRGRAESLTEPRTVEAGTIRLEPRAYCQVFYLIARADAQSEDMPADFDMFDQTLRVEGFYRAPDAAEDTPFAVATAVANGTTSDLFPPGKVGEKSAAFRLDTGRSGAEIIVRRDLDALFRGVDFAKMDERSIGRRLVGNLIESSRIEVRITAGAPPDPHQ